MASNHAYASVLAIPFMTRREHRRLIASLPRICTTCQGEEDVECGTCRGARVVGRLPRRLGGDVTFQQKYTAMWGPRIPEDVCEHMHRSARAARECAHRRA